MISKRTLLVLSTFVAAIGSGCSGDVEIADSGNGGSGGSSGSKATAGSAGKADAGSGSSGAGPQGGSASNTAGTGGSNAAGTGGAAAGSAGATNEAGAGGGACELEATSTLGGGTTKVTAGKYCDFWFVCFETVEAKDAAAAAHPELDCTSHSQACQVSCQFQLKDRALSEAELAEMCDLSTESSIELVCTNLE